jgi:ribosomal protein S24E
MVIFRLKNIFGRGRTTGFGYDYHSVHILKIVEPFHRKLKAGLVEKKKFPEELEKQ